MSRDAVRVRAWGGAGPDPVSLFTLTNARGLRLVATDWGASIVSLRMGDRDGRPADVVLGYDDPAGYRSDRHYLGCVVGRCANRIAGARFTLDGREHVLPANEGPHHLHGGPSGLHRRVWTGEACPRDEGPAVAFTVVSPAGEMGYPGTLTARVVYVLGDDDGLRIEMSAETDAPTLCNLAQHTYWNLAGHDTGPVHGHVLRSPATHWLPVDRGGIPVGGPRPVDGTPFDLRGGVRLGDRLGSDDLPDGYDHCLVLGGHAAARAEPAGAGEAASPPRPTLMAELSDPGSGRRLTLHADQPGVQVYTAGSLRARGRGGAAYGRHHGVCLETQLWPDAIHHPGWASPVLRPGVTYGHTMTLRFDTV